MTRKSPTLSIQERGGLHPYLDQYFSDRISPWRYKHFAAFCTSGVSKAGMAKILGVSRQTISKWVKIYEEEHNATGETD